MSEPEAMDGHDGRRGDTKGDEEQARKNNTEKKKNKTKTKYGIKNEKKSRKTRINTKKN